MNSLREFSLVACLCGGISAATAADLIDFWDTPRHGGNSFNRLPPDQAYFNALRNYGASWVRLSYDKWTPEGRDFLIGNADNYLGLQARDLKLLMETLDRAHAAGLKVVIAPLALPGMRWKQDNDGQFDDRIWQEEKFWQQTALFWRDLAAALKDHPAIAAYNLVNEPVPELRGGMLEHADLHIARFWYKNQQGTTRDLPAFYETVIPAIRQVDPVTPVMVDAGWYASADAFSYWPKPLQDHRVLYSFHMYEPFAATSAPNLRREKPYSYPGFVPYGGILEEWDSQRVREYLQAPIDWARMKGIPANRIVAGEFGCARRAAGCTQYLEDVLTVLDHNHLHWAFYSFREDSWDGMDYELGSEKVPWSYWKAVKEGKPDPLNRTATPEFEPIRKRLQPTERAYR